MPIYEYACEECGQVSEVLQKLSDPPLTVCATCGGPLRKLVSAPAFQFKGSGWYVTDYARKGGAGEGGKESAGKEPKESAGKESAGQGSGAESAGGDSGGGAAGVAGGGKPAAAAKTEKQA